MIDIENLSVTLGGRPVLTGVSTRIQSGEVGYLLGRNGAGKSTLLRAICGTIRPCAGNARVDGLDVARCARPADVLGVHLGADAAGHAYGPDRTHTARRHLRWLAAAGGVDSARVEAVLGLVGLAEDADTRVQHYSLGMRQRLAIAAALLSDAENLLFDEPLNGLDIDGIRWMRALLRRLAAQGRTVLVATHMMDEVARTGDRVVVLEAGHVVADTSVSAFIGSHDDVESAYVAVTSGTGGPQ